MKENKTSRRVMLYNGQNTKRTSKYQNMPWEFRFKENAFTAKCNNQTIQNLRNRKMIRLESRLLFSTKRSRVSFLLEIYLHTDT